MTPNLCNVLCVMCYTSLDSNVLLPYLLAKSKFLISIHETKICMTNKYLSSLFFVTLLLNTSFAYSRWQHYLIINCKEVAETYIFSTVTQHF